MFRKDDPLYYRDKINKLLAQAQREGLKIIVTVKNDEGILQFEATNGDTAGIIFGKKEED